MIKWLVLFGDPIKQEETTKVYERLHLIHGDDHQAWKREKQLLDTKVMETKHFYEKLICLMIVPMIWCFVNDSYPPLHNMDLMERPYLCLLGFLMFLCGHLLERIGKSIHDQLVFEHVLSQAGDHQNPRL
jgi:hypothetical protein